jgi:iron complex outermembrane receptor protein
MGRAWQAAVVMAVVCDVSSVWADDATPSTTAAFPVFELGEVIVTAGRAEEAPGAARVEGADIRTFDRTNLGRALQLLPGVSAMTGGSRYEQRYFVRGFTQRETPLLLDGIPVYTAYRGDIDAGRFTTYAVERIEVTRGISSVLHGPGALGGVVNVVSRRPVSEREGEAGFRLSLRDDLSTDGYESWFGCSAHETTTDHRTTRSLGRVMTWSRRGSCRS